MAIINYYGDLVVTYTNGLLADLALIPALQLSTLCKCIYLIELGYFTARYIEIMLSLFHTIFTCPLLM